MAVSAHAERKVRVAVDRDLQPLAVGPGRHDAAHLEDELLRREGDGLELEAPGLDLREVEDVVHEVEERRPREPQRADELRLLGVELGVGQELGESDHAGERRPDLVAHVREEGALGAGGRLGAAAGLLELLVLAGELGGPRRHLLLEAFLHPPVVQHRHVGEGHRGEGETELEEHHPRTAPEARQGVVQGQPQVDEGAGRRDPALAPVEHGGAPDQPHPVAADQEDQGKGHHPAGAELRGVVAAPEQRRDESDLVGDHEAGSRRQHGDRGG